MNVNQVVFADRADGAGWAGGSPRCNGVEAEYVDPGPGAGTEAAGGLLALTARADGPGAGLVSFRGQRNWPGWWWFSRTGAHVCYESWLERDVLMALDADPGVEAVASQPMWLHRVSESGRPGRHAPDFFVRRADGTGMLIDVRPDGRICAADNAVFAATAAMAGQVGSGPAGTRLSRPRRPVRSAPLEPEQITTQLQPNLAGALRAMGLMPAQKHPAVRASRGLVRTPRHRAPPRGPAARDGTG